MNETTKREPVIDAPLSEKEAASDSNTMSRRKALAILGKHTAYTAPAVLALLATKRVNAGSF
ncbi:MAG: hypothetical protein U1F76_26220 [Candidatus Competibacteraceae bacterium]